MTKLDQLLQQKLTTANYSFSARQQQQLLDYLLLLDKWNHAYNLTSVRDPKEMITQHILDSLAVSDYLNGQRILDVGTGAGLPGIPLAITQPVCEFVLLDSNGKKTRFLTHVIQQLNLTNITVVQARVEDYQAPLLFDSIISRAFSSIEDFLQKTQHLCAKQGQFLAMKGQYPQEELTAISKPFQVLAVHPLIIPGLNANRHLVCLIKE